MKGLKLSKEEDRTLRDMGVYHPHARTRRRAQGVRLLGQGKTLQQVADEFEVHLNSVEHWRQCWVRLGLVGLYEGHHTGRPPALSHSQKKVLSRLAEQDGDSSRLLCQRWNAQARWPIGRDTVRRTLRWLKWRYKRCRLSLRSRRNEAAFEHGQGVMASLRAMAQRGQCELLYVDEAGFSPNPPIQYRWTRIGHTRCAQSDTHYSRVNVLGALRHDHTLTWRLQTGRTTRDTVIAFLDELAKQSHTVPRIAVLDNAGIHKGKPIEERRHQWEQQGLYLYYLPPYSPELNKIEILWKQAKYFWRRFVYLGKEELQEEIRSIMQSYGTAFTVNFA